MEAELLGARRGALDRALAPGFATVNWLSLTVHRFVKTCNQARGRCRCDGLCHRARAHGPSAELDSLG